MRFGRAYIEQSGGATFVLIRAITYSAPFIGFLLVFLPGALLALWCIATFIAIGRGTPAPFDPPRRLVVAGPYRLVRNPMYLGAGLALAGAALFYGSWALLGYCAAFLLVTHLFVVVYEEPTLRSTFGAAYESYCERVRRWWPHPPKA